MLSFLVVLALSQNPVTMSGAFSSLHVRSPVAFEWTASFGGGPDVCQCSIPAGDATPTTTWSTVRSGSAYCDVDNDGQTLILCATNQPRIESHGLLIEKSATNLVKRSQDLDLWPTATDATVTPDSTAAPDGTVTGDTVEATGAGGLIESASWTGTAVPTTISVYARTVSGTQDAQLNLRNITAASDNCLTSMSVTTTWKRFKCTVTATTDTYAMQILPGGAGTGTIVPWGAQVEVDGHASSYIATGAATATRAADVVSFTRHAGWPMRQGTLCVGYSPLQSGDPPAARELLDATGYHFNVFTDSKLKLINPDATTTRASGAQTFTAESEQAFQWAWSGTTANAYVAAVLESSTGTWSPPGRSPTNIYLGSLSDGTGFAAGWIERVYASNSSAAVCP